jgi:hypothetical protein
VKEDKRGKTVLLQIIEERRKVQLTISTSTTMQMKPNYQPI